MQICERLRKGDWALTKSNKNEQGGEGPSFGRSFCDNVIIECPPKYIFDFNVL